MLLMALNKKYQGNTLPEVLIALAITSFCSTLAVIIYLNIQKSTLPFVRIKSNEIANKYLSEAITQREYFDNDYHEEEYKVKKRISRSIKYPDCMNLKIIVYDLNQKKLSELETIVYVE